MATIQTYRDLTTWQKAMELVDSVYKVTNYLPTDERFGLTSQLRRASVSVPSNIAEGFDRKNKKEVIRFYRYAKASLSEVYTQLEVCKRNNLSDEKENTAALELAFEVEKMLNSMISKFYRNSI